MIAGESLRTISKSLDQDTPPYEELGTEIAQSYFTFSVEMAVVIPMGEISDEELLPLLERSGVFDFWKNPEEDIYTLDVR
ncbi:MAG: hypothetical protein HYZ89_08340 [Candidatus Omnitrophica bacterium]|nr:hypothetical protein [Candidatus Omnitrophota bacterium]